MKGASHWLLVLFFSRRQWTVDPNLIFSFLACLTFEAVAVRLRLPPTDGPVAHRALGWNTVDPFFTVAQPVRNGARWANSVPTSAPATPAKQSQFPHFRGQPRGLAARTDNGPLLRSASDLASQSRQPLRWEGSADSMVVPLPCI